MVNTHSNNHFLNRHHFLGRGKNGKENFSVFSGCHCTVDFLNGGDKKHETKQDKKNCKMIFGTNFNRILVNNAGK